MHLVPGLQGHYTSQICSDPSIFSLLSTGSISNVYPCTCLSRCFTVLSCLTSPILKNLSWVWWHMSIIPELGRLRLEDSYKFETNLYYYKVSLRPAWNLISKDRKQKKTKQKTGIWLKCPDWLFLIILLLQYPRSGTTDTHHYAGSYTIFKHDKCLETENSLAVARIRDGVELGGVHRRVDKSQGLL